MADNVFDITKCPVPPVPPIPGGNMLQDPDVPDAPPDIPDCLDQVLPPLPPEAPCPTITVAGSTQGGTIAFVPGLPAPTAVLAVTTGDDCAFDFQLDIQLPPLDCPELTVGTATITQTPGLPEPTLSLTIVPQGDACAFEFNLAIEIPEPGCPDLEITHAAISQVPGLPAPTLTFTVLRADYGCAFGFDLDIVIPEPGCPALDIGTAQVHIDPELTDPALTFTVTPAASGCAFTFDFDLALPDFCPTLEVGSATITQDPDVSTPSLGFTITPGEGCAFTFALDIVIPQQCPELTVGTASGFVNPGLTEPVVSFTIFRQEPDCAFEFNLLLELPAAIANCPALTVDPASQAIEEDGRTTPSLTFQITQLSPEPDCESAFLIDLRLPHYCQEDQTEIDAQVVYDPMYPEAAFYVENEQVTPCHRIIHVILYLPGTTTTPPPVTLRVLTGLRCVATTPAPLMLAPTDAAPEVFRLGPGAPDAPFLTSAGPLALEGTANLIIDYVDVHYPAGCLAGDVAMEELLTCTPELIAASNDICLADNSTTAAPTSEVVECCDNRIEIDSVEVLLPPGATVTAGSRTVLVGCDCRCPQEYLRGRALTLEMTPDCPDCPAVLTFTLTPLPSLTFPRWGVSSADAGHCPTNTFINAGLTCCVDCESILADPLTATSGDGCYLILGFNDLFGGCSNSTPYVRCWLSEEIGNDPFVLLGEFSSSGMSCLNLCRPSGTTTWHIRLTEAPSPLSAPPSLATPPASRVGTGRWYALEIRNRSAAAVQLYYVDSAGQERLHGTVPAGQALHQSAPDSSVWVLRRLDGTDISVLGPLVDPMIVTLTGTIPELAAEET